MAWVGSLRGFGRQMGKAAFKLEGPAKRRLTDEAAQIGVEEAAKRTPVKRGDMLRSLSMDRSVPASAAYSRFGYKAVHAPIIIGGRRKSKSTKPGRLVGSTLKGRGNIAYRTRKAVDKRLGHIADHSIGKAL